MVGRSAHKRQPGGEVHTSLPGKSLEGGEPLVVIHRHNSVKLPVVAHSEEAVGCEGTECERSVLTGLVDGRYYHLLFLRPEQTSVAGMWIQRQHGYAGSHYAEILFQ